MKIHLVSDLHIETRKLYLPPTNADVTIFAGDIGVGVKGVDFAGEHAFATQKPIIYVCGNHEFYHHEINNVRKSIKDWSLDALNTNQFYFLDNSECVIEGVRFLGCTLWTDFMLFGEDNLEQCMVAGNKGLNDFHKIFNCEKKFTPADSLRFHQESVQWLETKVNEPFDGKTVVVTHHAPSFKSVSSYFQKKFKSACYASNLEYLMDGEKIALWVHGHMHTSLDYEVNGTRVLCNPRGYTHWGNEQQNENYKDDLVIEI